MDFFIGKEFEDAYPPEAAAWCNENNATIEQTEGGFRIVELPVYEPTYADNRRAEYPAIGEQLDMMYWDSVNGTHTWRDTIEAVKAKYPKE